MARKARVRLGRAAEMLGVSADTVRRWVDAGRLDAVRSASGQRLVELASIQGLLEARRQEPSSGRGELEATRTSSARNRFAGVVTRIQRDSVAAVVEVQAGPHRLVSLMTAEAVDELGLEVGRDAVCIVKATNVIVELPGR
ncbi:MAG TPA: TOBE domain-containing protein [Candidatus Binatus sp.]|nr:TOBE domain-containing protein [Candidatus Binatus sp.]